MKRAIENHRGEGYIWLAVLILFLSLLTSVLLLYLTLCGQVLNERRERKQALDSYTERSESKSAPTIRLHNNPPRLKFLEVLKPSFKKVSSGV